MVAASGTSIAAGLTVTLDGREIAAKGPVTYGLSRLGRDLVPGGQLAAWVLVPAGTTEKS